MNDFEYISRLLENASEVTKKFKENKNAKWSLRLENIRREIEFCNHSKR